MALQAKGRLLVEAGRIVEGLALLGTYWSCGDLDDLVALAGAAGLEVLTTRTCAGTARFASVDEFVATEVEGTPLRGRISDEVYDRLRQDAHRVLAPFVTAAGGVDAPLAGHIVVARRPSPPVREDTSGLGGSRRDLDGISSGSGRPRLARAAPDGRYSKGCALERRTIGCLSKTGSGGLTLAEARPSGPRRGSRPPLPD